MPGSSAASDAPSRPAEIPFRKEIAPGFDSSRWLLGVGIAIVVAGAVLWWLRRRMPGAAAAVWGASRRMKRIETLRLSPRSTLMLVEVDGRTVLVAEHPAAIALLPMAAAPARDDAQP